jgi:biopolymer transport protein ExbD
MAFGGFEDKPHQAPIAEINTTPLVDVMLVLLVIFIITAPLFTSAINLDLPKTDAASTAQSPQAITLAIDADHRLFWNNDPITPEALKARLESLARTADPPELRLRADKNTRYEIITQVMATAQKAGLQKIGFVTEPNKK